MLVKGRYEVLKLGGARYFLGVLTHTTAWDRLWGGDYTLKGIYVSLLTHAKQLSLVTFCETTAGIGKNGSVTYGRTDGRMDRRTDRREV